MPQHSERRKLSDVAAVSVVHLDQDRGLIVLDARPYKGIGVDELENRGINLSRDVILERTHRDFFTPKLKDVLRAIGNPQLARDRTLTPAALQTTAPRTVLAGQ